MNKIGLVLSFGFFSLLSTQALADRYAEQPVVNQECVKNLLLMQASSQEIIKELGISLKLIDSNKWVGVPDRQNLITSIEKVRSEYRTNYDYLSNNSKTKIVNELFKQECPQKSQEKLTEINDVAADSKKYRLALELTIANTSNIMRKNSCNIEEACTEQLNQALFDRLHPEIKSIVEKEVVTVEQEIINSKVKGSVKVNQSSSKIKKTSKNDNILLQQVDVKVCE